MIITRKDYVLRTDIIGFDLEKANGWTPDCGGKQDYDPAFVTGDSRVYPDGDYGCSIWIGEDLITETGLLSAGDVPAAKLACEKWLQEKGAIIRTAVVAALVKNGGQADDFGHHKSA